ncbi:MAG TPA: response regulator [Dehalococcoidia bacterium]|nr:response regulator [Dehalococcoidia bacterium]
MAEDGLQAGQEEWMSDAATNTRGAILMPSRPSLEGAGDRTAAPGSRPVNASDAISRATSGQPSRRVLIVDDDASILRMLRLVFQGDGFEVITATNGREALDVVSRHDPAVIVLDLEMPVMDGRTCFRELRSRGDATPVLILSAYGAERAKAELHAEGCVAKPFEPDHLIAEVERLLTAP